MSSSFGAKLGELRPRGERLRAVLCGDRALAFSDLPAGLRACAFLDTVAVIGLVQSRTSLR